MSARVTAFLGLDISRFASGLDKANGLMARFKALAKIGGLGGVIGGFLGAGALIAAFRGTLDHAKNLRDHARETGKEIDKWTAAVARFNDAIVGSKTAGAGLLTKGLGTVNMAGEGLGGLIGLALEKLGLREPGQTIQGHNIERAAEQEEADLTHTQKNIPEGFVRGHNRQMRALAREREGIAMSEDERIGVLSREARELRAEAAGMTRKEDTVERLRLEQEAAKLQLEAGRRMHGLTEDLKKAQEQRADFAREASVMEETTAEKVLRLRHQARIEDRRGLDYERDQSERIQHKAKAQRLRAEADRLDYESRNTPLTVAEAAARMPSGRRNTTSVGIAAQKIERFRSEANRFRALGRYDEAARLDELARTGQNDFEIADREARQGVGRMPSAGSWDARYGAMIAARNKSVEARYGMAGEQFAATSEQSKPSGSEAGGLQQAATDLIAAAAHLKTVEVTVHAA